MTEIEQEAIEAALEAIKTDRPCAYVSGWKIQSICQPVEFTLCMSTSSKSDSEEIARLISGRFEILATSDGESVDLDFTRIADE